MNTASDVPTKPPSARPPTLRDPPARLGLLHNRGARRLGARIRLVVRRGEERIGAPQHESEGHATARMDLGFRWLRGQGKHG